MANISKLFELEEEHRRKTLRASLPLDMIYMNIPKCGCTTIKSALWEAAGSLEPYDHFLQFDSNFISAFTYKKEDLKKLGSDPFVFTVVRNPYARIYSAYYDKIYRAIIQNRDMLPVLKANFKFSKKYIPSFHDFLAFIKKTPDEERNSHWRSMSYQSNIKYIKFDHIGSLEALHETKAILEERLRCKYTFEFSKQNNTFSRDTVKKAYDKKAQSLVLNMFYDDFENFGYSVHVDDLFSPPSK